MLRKKKIKLNTSFESYDWCILEHLSFVISHRRKHPASDYGVIIT